MSNFFNSSIFDFEDLYNPSLNQLYSVYWDVTLIITTLFFIVMLYVIITKSSKDFGSYKWYLCHQLFWSYAFDLHMSLWKPVPLWPFYIGFSAGFYRNFTGMYTYIPMILMTFTSVGLGFSIFLSTIHRYVHATPLSTFFKLYNILSFRFLLYFIIFIVLEALLCIPLILFIPDIDYLKNSLIAQNFAFQEIVTLEPSLFGYDREHNGNVFIIVMIGIIVVLILTIISIICLYFNFLRIIRNNKATMSATTIRVQAMLFRALCIQMFFAVILLLLPITAAISLSIFGFKWVPKFSICAIMITAIHTLFDFTAIIYSVKCYRMFFYGKYLYLLRKLGLNSPKYTSTLFLTITPTVWPLKR